MSGQSGFETKLPQPKPVNANFTISKIEGTGDVATTTTTTTTSSTTTTLPQLCGDFDGNGTVQVSDALDVLRASVGHKPCAFCICDLDGNGIKSVLSDPPSPHRNRGQVHISRKSVPVPDSPRPAEIRVRPHFLI